MLEAANAWSKRLRSEAEPPAALDLLVDRVESRPDYGIQLSIKLPTESSEKLVGCAPAPLKLTRLIPLKMRRRGVEMKFVVNGDSKALQNELMPCRSKPAESPRGPKHPDWSRLSAGIVPASQSNRGYQTKQTDMKRIEAVIMRSALDDFHRCAKQLGIFGFDLSEEHTKLRHRDYASRTTSRLRVDFAVPDEEIKPSIHAVLESVHPDSIAIFKFDQDARPETVTPRPAIHF